MTDIQLECLGIMTLYFAGGVTGFYFLAGAIEIVDWWSRRRGGSKKKKIVKKEK